MENIKFAGIAPILNYSTAREAENTINSSKSIPVTETALRPENSIAAEQDRIRVNYVASPNITSNNRVIYVASPNINSSNRVNYAASPNINSSNRVNYVASPSINSSNRVSYVASPNITSNTPEIGSFNLLQTDKRTNAKVHRITPNVQPLSDNIVSQSRSNAYGKAAELLQSELLTLLKTMEAKDHESMSREANAFFSILDDMLIDYRHFKEQVMELINSAKLLHEIEESVPENDSVQKLADRFFIERKKLDEIISAHATAVDTVENSRKRIKALEEEISLKREWLNGAEADLLWSEEELKTMENQLANL